MKLCLVVLFLAFVQNVSFSMVSRSRNRNNFKYHMFCSIGSNGIWFLSMKALVSTQMNLMLFPFYTAGTVAGSLCGTWVSMRIEKWLHADSDSHIKPKVDLDLLSRRVDRLEELCRPVPYDNTSI